MSMTDQSAEQAEQVTIEAYTNDRAGVVVIRIPGISAGDVMRHSATAELRGQLVVMERRALDAERAALDAGKANADAIAAAVKDAMARLAAEFAAEASSGTYGQWRRETFEACSARCRELAK